jgi:FtsP/CotA-like multicopper oxidase with cupredoxin domain
VRARFRKVTLPVTHTDRRTLLRSGLAATTLGVLGAATGCTTAASPAKPRRSAGGPHLIGPDSPQVAAAEAARPKTGAVISAVLAAAAGPVDLGGLVVNTWSYRGQVPGPEIRVRKGDVVRATVGNHLPDQTTVHWHGVAIRNNMDGVPMLTQAPVPAGGALTYQFTASDPGTYWYHPHVGVQLDRGLYGPLIVEDPAEPAPYDQEWTVVLDDWIDGTGYTPDQVLTALRQGMTGMNMSSASPSPSMSGTGGMSGMTVASPSPSTGGISGMPGMNMASPSPSTSGMASMGSSGSSPLLSGATSTLLGGDAGDVRYPYYLINGRIRTAPRTFTGRPGQRVRIRFINAGADTAFRVALGGHTMTITHTDGFPVTPQPAGALLIGMGERYDVQVTLGDGMFPLVALAEGKNSTALALVSTGMGTPPAPDVLPRELYSPVTTSYTLKPTATAALSSRQPDVTYKLQLTGGMARYNWGINGQAFDMTEPGALRFLMKQGQRVRVIFANATTMYHPMHIHGHTFQVASGGPRKDTVLVLPRQQVACDFDADNPGQWMTHCHNLYHSPEGGMMAVLGYQT